MCSKQKNLTYYKHRRFVVDPPQPCHLLLAKGTRNGEIKCVFRDTFVVSCTEVMAGAAITQYVSPRAFHFQRGICKIYWYRSNRFLLAAKVAQFIFCALLQSPKIKIEAPSSEILLNTMSTTVCYKRYVKIKIAWIAKELLFPVVFVTKLSFLLILCLEVVNLHAASVDQSSVWLLKPKRRWNFN